MARRNRGGHNYKFTEKTHSVSGMIAIVLAVLSLIACGCMVWYSFSHRGSAGIYIGSAGIFGFLVAVVAFFTSIHSIREPEKFRVIPYTSLGFSVVSVVVWVAIYLGVI
jgi:uncharacterized membrane protein YidH (DUF202 family)